MKHSIRHKMIAILITIVGSVLLLTWILNSTFAEKYYISTETASITNTFEEVRSYLNDDSLIMINENLELLTNRSNVKMMVAKSSNIFFDPIVIFSNMTDGTQSYQEILQYLDQVRYLLEKSGSSPFHQRRFKRWLLEDKNDNLTSLATKGYYVTQIRDKRNDQNGLYLFGFTENDYLVAMRISIDGIRTSIRITSRFMAYMSLVAIFLGIMFVYVYAYTFTKPIKEMAQVANRMAELDFDSKVETMTEDELGVLGRSINQLSNTLEATIGDLKAANLELQQDIAKKEEIDEMRKEFLSHVSHELKTPISIIQGYAEGLCDGIAEDKESMDFYCEVIMDEAQKMNQMVQRLLTLNELEFGNTQLTITRFDLQDMIQTAINNSQILFTQNNIQVEFEEAGPVYAWADEFMIEKVFTNYLTNAIHYVCENGKIRIWFEKTAGNIRTFVYNEGNPIPEEELEKLWIKFYKVDKARTREYGGNGIGLSIVAAVMKSHNKDYGVYNLENGVVFYFDVDGE